MSYDVIWVDAFARHLIPFHLTTKEFYAELRSRLKPNGVVAVNLASSGEGGDLLRASAVVETMKTSFPRHRDLRRERSLADSTAGGGKLDFSGWEAGGSKFLTLSSFRASKPLCKRDAFRPRQSVFWIASNSTMASPA